MLKFVRIICSNKMPIKYFSFSLKIFFLKLDENKPEYLKFKLFISYLLNKTSNINVNILLNLATIKPTSFFFNKTRIYQYKYIFLE